MPTSIGASVAQSSALLFGACRGVKAGRKVGHFCRSTLGAPASALGVIEGISDGLAGVAQLGGGALADDPHRRRTTAVGGYATTAVLSALIGTAQSAC